MGKTLHDQLYIDKFEILCQVLVTSLGMLRRMCLLYTVTLMHEYGDNVSIEHR